MKLSIDLGGTNVRIAQVENGICLNKMSVPCLAQQDASAVLDSAFSTYYGYDERPGGWYWYRCPFNCRCGKRYRV